MDIEKSTPSSENPVYMPAYLFNFLFKMDKDNLGMNFLPTVNKEIRAKTNLIFEDAVHRAQSRTFDEVSPEEALRGMFLNDDFPQALNINVIPQYAPPELAESAWKNIRSVFQPTDLLSLKESELWTETKEDKYNGKADNLPTIFGEDFTLNAYETKHGSWMFILSIKGIEGVEMVINNLPEAEVLAFQSDQ